MKKLISILCVLCILFAAVGCTGQNVSSSVSPSFSSQTASSGQSVVPGTLSLPGDTSLAFLQADIWKYFEKPPAQTFHFGSIMEIEGEVYYISATKGTYKIIKRNLGTDEEDTIFTTSSEILNAFMPMFSENKLALLFEQPPDGESGDNPHANSLYFYDLETKQLASFDNTYGVEERYCTGGSYTNGSLYVFMNKWQGEGGDDGTVYHLAGENLQRVKTAAQNQYQCFFYNDNVLSVSGGIVYLTNQTYPDMEPILQLNGLHQAIYIRHTSLVVLGPKVTGQHYQYAIQVDLQTQELTHTADLDLIILGNNPWQENLQMIDSGQYLVMRDEYEATPEDYSFLSATLYQYDFDGNELCQYPSMPPEGAPILMDCCVSGDTLYYLIWDMPGSVSLHTSEPTR